MLSRMYGALIVPGTSAAFARGYHAMTSMSRFLPGAKISSRD